MGKNWRVPKTRDGKKVNVGHSTFDIASCRGHSAVLATCDTVREREGTKELINLLNQAIEALYPEPELVSNDAHDSIPAPASMSIEQLLQEEIQQVRVKSDTSTQKLLSIRTDITGVILVKVINPAYCVIKLVDEIFQRVEREKKPISKNIIRLIPLKRVFFPNEEELLEGFMSAMTDEYPGIIYPRAKAEIARMKVQKSIQREANKKMDSEDNENNKIDESADEQNSKRVRVEENTCADIISTEPEISLIASQAIPDTEEPIAVFSEPHNYSPFTCHLLFRARNHNTLNKVNALNQLTMCMPPFGRLTYINPQVHVIVEALKNICGLSVLHNYSKYLEFNLRKFQGANTDTSQLSRVSNANNELNVPSKSSSSSGVVDDKN